MADLNAGSPEQEIWDLYLRECEKDGKKPSIPDFTKWTKQLLAKNKS